jgi:quercetin dioxygenase-like cupin family protein
MMILMEDGNQIELRTGDAAVIPAGHDAWVIGDEPCVLIDFTGAKEYSQSAQPQEKEYEFQERFTDFD